VVRKQVRKKTRATIGTYATANLALGLLGCRLGDGPQRPRGEGPRPWSAINFATMGDPDDEDQQEIVVN
jgi:hypothetical protein